MYSIRNLIIGYCITIGVVLLIVLSTFSNLWAQNKELAKILRAREALQKLQPALVDLQEYEALRIKANSDQSSSANIQRKLQQDSLFLQSLAVSHPESLDKYTQLSAIFERARHTLDKDSLASYVASFKTISESLEDQSRKILSISYDKSLSLTRRAVVFISIISAVLLLAVGSSFIFSYRDIKSRISYNKKLEKQVTERVKELKTLYTIGQIFAAENMSVESALKEVVTVLPKAWQYPDITAARIILGDEEYKTTKFAESVYKQKRDFRVSGDKQGSIEIVYLEKRSEEAEGPFLAEERNLLNLVTDMLRNYLVRKASVELILKEKNLSDSVINSLPGVFFLQDLEGRYLRWNKRLEEVSGYTAEELREMNAMNFFEPAEKELVQQKIEQAIKTGYGELEVMTVTKNGSKIPFYFTGQVIMYEDKLCIIGTGIDITARKLAEEKLKQSYKEIRLLTEHQQNIREQERAHMAREIHDELGQQLTVLKMDVAWLSRKLDGADETVKEKLKDLLDLLDGTVKSVRRISSELRPSLLDDLGLVAAIEWHLKEFEKRSGIKTHFDEPESDLLLIDSVRTGLFRIFQESVTNVARHSEATKLKVHLSEEAGTIMMSIEDNGKGFDKEKAAEKKTLGILGMRERTAMMGGEYNITSTPGQGTTVVVIVPYEDNKK